MENAAAVLTIHNAADMTEKGRKNIGKWLDRQKKRFLNPNVSFNSTFEVRFLYEEGRNDLSEEGEE